jgi:hypothetical protein
VEVVLVGVAVGVRAIGPVADVLDEVGVLDALDALDVVAGPQPAVRSARAVAETARKVDCRRFRSTTRSDPRQDSSLGRALSMIGCQIRCTHTARA